MKNAGLDEAQAGIKVAGRNINNLRYADDRALMAESEEKLQSLFMKVKEESEKAGFKLNFRKTKNYSVFVFGPVTSWKIDGETMETVRDFIFLSSKITVDGDCSHEIKKQNKTKQTNKKQRLLLARKAMKIGRASCRERV